RHKAVHIDRGLASSSSPPKHISPRPSKIPSSISSEQSHQTSSQNIPQTQVHPEHATLPATPFGQTHPGFTREDDQYPRSSTPSSTPVNPLVTEDLVLRAQHSFKRRVIEGDIRYKEEATNVFCKFERILASKKAGDIYSHKSVRGEIASRLEIPFVPLEERYVQLHSRAENGSDRPLCAFIHHLDCVGVLDSPMKAARYVALIPSEPTILSSRKDSSRTQILVSHDHLTTPYISSLHSSLFKHALNSINRAILLCCVLRGFGLRAFVCLGSSRTLDGSIHKHEFVMTIEEALRTSSSSPSKDEDESADCVACIWEPTTGERYFVTQRDSIPMGIVANGLSTRSGDKLPVRSIDCIFNDEDVCINVQQCTLFGITCLEIDNSSYWIKLNPDIVRSVNGYGAYSLRGDERWVFPLLPSFHQGHKNVLEQQLEAEVCKLLAQRRADEGKSTKFDGSNRYRGVLSELLWGYEEERMVGAKLPSVVVGVMHCSSASARLIPDGFTMNSFPFFLPPFNLSNMSKYSAFLAPTYPYIPQNSDRKYSIESGTIRSAARAIFQTALSNERRKNLIDLDSDEMCSLCCIRVFPYAERVCAIWCSIGVVCAK
ncbi:hypothetical protein ADUPG1_011155, partial [Aduncisulcus paluster]